MAEAADQCIICLESLDAGPDTAVLPQKNRSEQFLGLKAAISVIANSDSSNTLPVLDNQNLQDDKCTTSIAVLQECGHHLHNECLRTWSQKANSCPICRKCFHVVDVFDKLGGSQISSYSVIDKKQAVEWDHAAWLEANQEAPVENSASSFVEPEDDRPCVICDRADQEEVLLLCDGCNAPYHSHCVELHEIPRGQHWYCVSCEGDAPPDSGGNTPERSLIPALWPRTSAPYSYFPRTRESEKRALRRAREDPWRGAWVQFTESVYDALDFDLDYHDVGDEELEAYRRTEQLRDREQQEYRRWQQRLNIATRAGAGDVFRSNIPSLAPPAPAPAHPRTVQEVEEMQSWRALDKATEAATERSKRRRTDSPEVSSMAPAQPERKLKRPRTRRLPPSSVTTQLHPLNTESQGAPTFVSALLDEIKPPAQTDGSARGRNWLPWSSPPNSPRASIYASPGASPPPFDRPNSPTLPLSSHIEPNYPPANYRPRGRSGSDAEPSHPVKRKGGTQKQGASFRCRSEDMTLPGPPTSLVIRSRPENSGAQSPTLSLEAKENVSSIVRDALAPHWSRQEISSEQYESINRDVSRKLYGEVTRAGSLNDETRQTCEQLAYQEVARAVELSQVRSQSQELAQVCSQPQES